MSDDKALTRRETLKLAAAIAAFGAALGFRRSTADAVGPEQQLKLGRPEQQLKLGRREFKSDRLEIKFYDGPKLLHTCEMPAVVLVEMKRGRKLDHKWYRDGAVVMDPYR